MNMSIEEIIRDSHKKFGDYGGNEYVAEQVAVSSAKEFAKQQSIAFADWVNHHWHNILGQGWILQTEAMKCNPIEETMQNLISIEKVYELFLTQQSQK